MKKIIFLLICVALSFSLLACDMIVEKWNELTGNNAELPLEDSQGLLYEFDEEAQGYVVKGISKSAAAHIVVPDTYGDYPVVAIGERAFYNCETLISVTIPDSVTPIGYSAFESCSSLTSVTIPNSITAIGSSAFESCSTLKDVYITDVAAWCNISFGNYSANPLYYAKNLYLNGELITELVIPDSVTTIGSYAFSRCSSLTSATIPDSVTTIGDYAFSYCDSLTSITIPDSVTTIGYKAFYFCSSLTSVTFEDPTGWWCAFSSNATSGTAISESNLANASTAVKYLRSSYYDRFWFKD